MDLLNQIFFKTAFSSELGSNTPPHLLPRLKAGYLLLETKEGRKWTRYVVALAGTNLSNLALYYYDNPTDKEPVGCIQLHSAHIDVLSEMIMVITQEDTWFLCAENEKEAEEWVNTICNTLESASRGQNVGTSSHVLKRRRLSSRVTMATIKEIQSRDTKTRIYEFRELFIKTSSFELKSQASKGSLAWSCLRSITWRLWLEYYPLDVPFKQWPVIAHTNRSRYDMLQQLHPIENLEEELSKNAHDEEREIMIPDIATLAITEEEVEDAALLADICKDVKRTRSGMDYFREDSVQHMLVRILYTWAKVHSDVSYKQGMSELLAVIIHLLHVEKWPLDKKQDTEPLHSIKEDILPFGEGQISTESVQVLLETTTDGHYMEHDAFLLLEKIMARMHGVFCPKRRKSLMMLQVPLTEDSFSGTTLNAQLNYIHNTVLATCDPQLYASMERFGLEPQMYLLRWVRLLLSREFQMYHVWHIWDAIFSLTPEDFRLIDFLCVAAVRHFRNEIMEAEDVPSVLMCLRTIEQHMSVETLVDKARQLYEQQQASTVVKS